MNNKMSCGKCGKYLSYDDLFKHKCKEPARFLHTKSFSWISMWIALSMYSVALQHKSNWVWDTILIFLIYGLIYYFEKVKDIVIMKVVNRK